MEENFLQQAMVCDVVFLKAIEEGCWCVLHFRLLNDHNTLKVRVHTGGLCVGSNGNVGVVTSAPLGVINFTKALVEQVIETFMNIICLSHYHCVAFNDRVTNGSNCVDLEGNVITIHQKDL